MKIREYRIGKSIITLSKTEKGVYADVDHGLRHRLYYADNAEKLMSEIERGEGLKFTMPCLSLIGR